MMILETPRLYLRHYINEDIDALYHLFSDPETMQFYPSPFSFQQTEQWIQRNIARYDKDGFGLWAVCLKDTHVCIGDCGLIKQQINGKTEIEVGYHISKQHWSKGYASEAALACKEYGFYQVGLSKLVSIIDPRNMASIRVAEKIGFSKEEEAVIFNKNHYIYSCDKASKSK
ncbi:Protein N-acetyltransferase, RimJ/RimL family [Paenibacillus sp. 1_12]|uniref:GNAT family N-acetyltransferase n=1 Tax=Paenibacillus sp. 1_12 TaxID=1566278 RepID=UPI0008DF7CF9|nr:GNAT family N-acetyltransferase [Paenibacillus sp. 1_12]SFL77065.1 Protein N-acetyltransferase, RimJ/RimL family [Paenibacillus sp. 1_12]